MVLSAAATAGDRNGAGANGFYVDLGSFGRACNGDCSITAFTGQQTTQAISPAFGIADFTQGEFGFVPIVPIWDWAWDESWFVGASYSRRILSFGHSSVGEVISLEAEAGLGKRFGTQTEFEAWAALYARWHLFPWNKWVKTTIGVSTGLSWASGISAFEKRRSGNNEGSQLLHYLSPEATFALPSNPNRELVFRFSHRSGGSDMFGPDSIFNHTGGGAQYFLIGTRFRF